MPEKQLWTITSINLLRTIAWPQKINISCDRLNILQLLHISGINSWCAQHCWHPTLPLDHMVKTELVLHTYHQGYQISQTMPSAAVTDQHLTGGTDMQMPSAEPEKNIHHMEHRISIIMWNYFSNFKTLKVSKYLINYILNSSFLCLVV